MMSLSIGPKPPASELNVLPAKAPSSQSTDMHITPPQSLTMLNGPGPTGHHLSMRFADVLSEMHAQLADDDLEDLDLTSWGDVAECVKSSELRHHLKLFAEAMARFEAHGANRHESECSYTYARKWGHLLDAVRADGGVGMREFQSIRWGHQFPLLHADKEAAKQRKNAESKNTEAGARTCDFGASVEDSCEPDKTALNPILLGELKLTSSLGVALSGSVLFQVQSEMFHVRATNASHAGDLAQPILSHFMSTKAFLLQLMLPCQDDDVLAHMYPSNKSPSDFKGMLIPITLVALERFPTEAEWMAIAASMLQLQLQMARQLLANDVDGVGNGQLHPDKRLRGLVLQQPEELQRNLWVYRPRLSLGEVEEAMTGFSDTTCVKVFDYYHSSPQAWYSDLQVPKVDQENRRQAPDETLLAVLNSCLPMPWDMQVVRGGPDCAILIYPFLPGDHTPKSWRQMLEVLEQMKAVHVAGYAHGDILAQNIVFGELPNEPSAVIDLDLARRVDGQGDAPLYVLGYNRDRHSLFRHPQAQAGLPMSRNHDCYSLARLIDAWFQAPVAQRSPEGASVGGPASDSEEEDSEIRSFVRDLEVLSYLTDDFMARAPTTAQLKLGAKLSVGWTGSPKRV